jgi:hypothetical protein
MQRKVQIYIQTDTINEQDCSCLILHWDNLIYRVYSNSADGDGFNIFTFEVDSVVYTIRRQIWEGDMAWVLIHDSIVQGGTYENTDINCPVSNQWTIRDFWTESCTISKDYYERLELFNDEKIILNASVQNIADISKVFSDYSQSFVVPASTINNKILEHWYESDVNPLQDNRIRRKARIEIDHIPFRTGNIQLEKANIKNKRPESYTLQFFGDLVSLKDNLGEASLNTLDLSSYSFEYNLTNVSDLISFDFDQNVAFPLISSKNLWTYDDGGTYDIHDPVKAIYFTELFPAIKVKELFNRIQSQYNIVFNSNFFNNQRFTKLWLWLKNQEIKLNGNIPYIDASTNQQLINVTSNTNSSIYIASSSTIHLESNENEFTPLAVNFVASVSSTSSTSTYFILVYKNDILLKTIQGNDNNSYQISYYSAADWTNINDNYKLYLKSSIPMTMDIELDVRYSYPTGTNHNYANYSATLIPNLNLNQLIPDVKITDFLVGILKQFNLTCVPLSETEYQIEPLDSWYKLGEIYDITNYVDVESIDIERTSLYKAINFTHQQSESFINRQFTAGFGYEYGDIKQGFVFDGGEFTIDLPFENIRFIKFEASRIAAGYCLNTSYNDYVPKPVLLYNYELQSSSVDFYLTDGSTTNNLYSYLPFGQDLKYGDYDLTLNFNTEYSELLSKNILITSYSMYYESYINNLYSVKNRIVTVKANIPLSILSKLKLNDRLIIKDKRYIINDYQADLTSGDVQFKLLLDFREIETLDLYDDPETIPFPAE